MGLYIISYDLRKKRNYLDLYQLLEAWNAVRLLESVWLAELKGPCPEIRRILLSKMDNDDGVCVIELNNIPMDWAAKGINQAAVNWLQSRSP